MRTIGSTLLTLLFLAYPYLVYYWLELGKGGLAPVILATLFGVRALTAHGRAKLGFLVVAFILIAGATQYPGLTAKLTPAMVHFGLALLFGKTLLHGPSLAERLVRLEHPVFPPGVARYCLEITIAWTALFVFNSIVCLVLAFSTHNGWWAIYNGGIVFVLMGLLAVGEYIVRRRRFPLLNEPAPVATMIRIIKNSLPVCRDVFFVTSSGPASGRG
jgi:uncharacterized membrane protein